GEGLFLRYLLKPLARRTFLRHVCADMRHAEAELAGTDLDWTIVRPPRLTNGPVTGKYRTAAERDLPRRVHVSRADLPHYMLSLLGDGAGVRRHVAMAY